MNRILHARSNITVSFAENLKLFLKKTSTHLLWGNSGKSKEKIPELIHCMFEIAIYRAFHELSNIAAPFPEKIESYAFT